MQIFPHSDVDMCLNEMWMSLNSYKQYLFGFETLQIVYVQLKNAPKTKENLKSFIYHYI